MISTRKRKMMVRKLHSFFSTIGKIPTEAEYRAYTSAPYRMAFIDRYLGNWDRAVTYVQYYYPQWQDKVPVMEKKVSHIDLDALEEKEDE